MYVECPFHQLWATSVSVWPLWGVDVDGTFGCKARALTIAQTTYHNITMSKNIKSSDRDFKLVQSVVIDDTCRVISKIIRRRFRRLVLYDAFCRRFFLSFDATAQQRLDGFSPNLYHQTLLRCYSLMVVPPWKSVPPQKTLGLKTSIFGEKIQTPPSWDGRRGNEEKFRENDTTCKYLTCNQKLSLPHGIRN